METKEELQRRAEVISETCNQCGQLKIDGISIESADKRLLDVREGTFDDHVATMPGAVAYFGEMKAQADAYLSNKKRAYDRWKKKKYLEVKAALSGGTKKATIADIEAELVVRNEYDIEQWEDEINQLQALADTFTSYYDAWRQKSFSLREYGKTLTDEKMTTSHLSYGNKEWEGEQESDYEKFKKIRHGK